MNMKMVVIALSYVQASSRAAWQRSTERHWQEESADKTLPISSQPHQRPPSTRPAECRGRKEPKEKAEKRVGDILSGPLPGAKPSRISQCQSNLWTKGYRTQYKMKGKSIWGLYRGYCVLLWNTERMKGKRGVVLHDLGRSNCEKIEEEQGCACPQLWLPHVFPAPGSNLAFTPSTSEEKAFKKLNITHTQNEIFFSHSIYNDHHLSFYNSILFFSHYYLLRSFHSLHINPLLSQIFPPLLFTSTLPLPQFLQVCFPSACLGLSPFSIILHLSSAS